MLQPAMTENESTRHAPPNIQLLLFRAVFLLLVTCFYVFVKAVHVEHRIS